MAGVIASLGRKLGIRVFHRFASKATPTLMDIEVLIEHDAAGCGSGMHHLTRSQRDVTRIAERAWQYFNLRMSPEQLLTFVRPDTGLPRHLAAK